MRRIFLLLTVVSSFCLSAFAQTGVRWDLAGAGSAGVVSVSGAGQPFLIAQPNVTLNFCTYPANASPCTNFAVTYTDLSLGTNCPSNAQIVLQGGNTCQATSDNFGNLGVYAAAGAYSYTLTVGAVTFGPFTLTLGGSGGGGGGSTVVGTPNQILASVGNPQILSLANPTSFPGAVIIPAGQLTLTGDFQGFAFIADITGHVIQDGGVSYASAFSNGVDPCDKIAKAFAILASPGNGVVDARGLGFGNLTPACSATTAHAMFQSVTSGYVILGNYTIYVPLATSAAANGLVPSQGVIPLPNKFVGIKGAGRGDAGTSAGTTFAVCKGLNNPVTGCVAPQTREQAVTTTAIVYANNVPYLHVLSTGMDYVAGEPVRIRGSSKKDNDGAWTVCNLSVNNSTRTNSNCPANPTATDIYLAGPPGITSVTIGGAGNGAYSGVCTVSGGTGLGGGKVSATLAGGNIATITVTNPGRYTAIPTIACAGGAGQTFTATLLTACGASCGTISGGIPVFETTPQTGNRFAQRLEDLSIDCEGVMDCEGYRSLTGNEQSGLRHVKISGSPERDIDVHTFIAQNADAFESLELYAGSTLGANCDVGTTAAFFGENGPHGIRDFTINFGTCAHTVAAGLVIENNVYPVYIQGGHCENVQQCFHAGMGAPAQFFHLTDDAGGPTSQCGDPGCVPLDGPFQQGTSTVVRIEANFLTGSPATSDFELFNIARNNATNVLEDLVDQTLGTTDHTTNQNSLEMYVVDAGSGCNAVLTTDTTITSNLCVFSVTNGLTAGSVTTTGLNGGLSGIEGTGANDPAAAGSDTLFPDSTLHCWHQTLNNADKSCTPTTQLATGTSVALTGPTATYVCTSTCTVTPPVPVAGFQFCVYNGDNVNTVITLAALGSSARYENTARTAYGTAGVGTFISGGAVKDFVCLMGLDSTHYITTSFNGTWTAN